MFSPPGWLEDTAILSFEAAEEALHSEFPELWWTGAGVEPLFLFGGGIIEVEGDEGIVVAKLEVGITTGS